MEVLAMPSPMFFWFESAYSNFKYLVLLYCIYRLIARCFLYDKAGERPWGALIPFYSQYLYCKITTGRGWLFLLFFIPFVNFIFGIYLLVPLAKSFGKSGWFAVGLFFLEIIYLTILAFGEPRYVGVPERDEDEFTL
ncbi:MAG: DUF5684 domain-containing protein [Christensenella sp.]|nr:DUF5684 domain-containing protein [Christensenella sp.]